MEEGKRKTPEGIKSAVTSWLGFDVRRGSAGFLTDAFIQISFDKSSVFLFLPQKKSRINSYLVFLQPPQKLTVVGEVLRQVEEGDRHQDVEGPVDSGRAGVARAPRPQRVDFRVDGPRHRTHP